MRVRISSRAASNWLVPAGAVIALRTGARNEGVQAQHHLASHRAPRVCGMSSISSSAAAASASSAWADMPFELFGIIFAHVPLRARLRVVSAVCQRWRRAVLRMPVRWYRTNVPSAAIRLLNVTELDVRSIFPFPLPKSLRVRYHHPHAPTHCPPPHLEPAHQYDPLPRHL